MQGKPEVFYNVLMREMREGDDTFYDVWADDQVTLWLQYSTQWDSLAHVGAEFDADGDGVAEAVYYNGYRAGVDLVGPEHDARGDGAGHALLRAPPRARAHGVPRRAGARACSSTSRTTSGDEAQAVKLATLQEIMAADNVVVEPGDMLLLHTGFATKVLEWNKRSRPGEDPPDVPALDPRDESLLEWIAESRISALVADNYAVEAMLGGGPLVDGKRTLLPIHHLCLFKLGVPLGEMWYLARARDVAARARPEPLPAHRAAAAPARHRGLARSPRSRRSEDAGLTRSGRVPAVRTPSTSRRPGSRRPPRRR